MLESLLLAVLQGIAEFLPISSSGHLVLGKHLLGLGEAGIRLDVMLHVGTLLAVFVFYFSVIRRIVLLREWRYVLKIVLSAVPAGMVGVLLKTRFSSVLAMLESPAPVGIALLLTGMVLVLTRFLPRGSGDVSFGRALWMGLAQAVAIVPGISRSGMTIAAARLSGVEAEKCAEFSFLMSAPPIAGAALLEVLHSFASSAESVAAATEVPWIVCLVSAALSAVVGYFSLALLVKVLKGKWFWLFGPYCFLAGVISLLMR